MPPRGRINTPTTTRRPRVAGLRDPRRGQDDAENPSAEDPSAEDPSAEDPSAENPSAEDPSAGEPDAGAPDTTTSAPAESAATSTVEDPAVEDPATENGATDTGSGRSTAAAAGPDEAAEDGSDTPASDGDPAEPAGAASEPPTAQSSVAPRGKPTGKSGKSAGGTGKPTGTSTDETVETGAVAAGTTAAAAAAAASTRKRASTTSGARTGGPATSTGGEKTRPIGARRRPAPATGAARGPASPETPREPGRFRQAMAPLARPVQDLRQSPTGLPVALGVVTVVFGALAVLGFVAGYQAWTYGPRANSAVVDANATADLVGQSRQDIEGILSFDFQHLDEPPKALPNLATSSFIQQYQSVYEQGVRPTATDQQLRQQASVLQIGARSITGDHARVIALVSFHIERAPTNQGSDAPGLVNVDLVQIDGRWRVDRLAPLTNQG